ncbi:unnamed protein product [Sphenostylis stenocarpa]|uniref:Uncharacterized protein n=1 Tax=Sphenostylis stenocarpa TaxID=92480 RepID=A0AA86VFM1_9FABA|nr:unnamed protein product [Sphenostylis stenocarpa]
MLSLGLAPNATGTSWTLVISECFNPRKQLQALCKKNKIPANITNVAMAENLTAMDKVEGLDEILNPIEGDAGTPNVNIRMAGRASTQRKAPRAEAEGSNVKVSVSARPLRGAGAGQGVVEQKNKDANVPPGTPAVSVRRATAVSTRRKKEVEMVEEDGDKKGVEGQPLDVPKTPVAASVSRRRATGRSVRSTKKIENTGGTSVQRTYGTRRSVRLLEKDMSKMGLIDTEDTGSVKIDDDVSQELSNISHQVEDSCDTEKGSSLQIDSAMDTQELEVCSFDLNTVYECQSHDSVSDMKLVSVTENDTVVEPQGSDEAEREKINFLELEAEPNASDEAGSEPFPVLEETCDSSELETENKECVGARRESFHSEPFTDAIMEVTGQEIADMVPDNVSVDVTVKAVAGSLPMIADCKMDDQVRNKGGDQEDNNNDQDVLVEHMDDKEVKSNEPEEDDEYLTLEIEESSESYDKSDDQGSDEVSSVREERIEEFTCQDASTLTVVLADDVSDEDVPASLPMSPVCDDPADINESVECITGDSQVTNKVDDNQEIKDETEHLNLACRNVTDEDNQCPLNVDEKAANESDLMTLGSEGVLEFESISNFPGELQEEVKENKPEQMEAGTDKAPDVTDICTESSANGQPEESVNLEAEPLAEESEDPVAGHEVMLGADRMCTPQVPLVHQQVSVESASGALDGELSCKSNVPVDGEVVSEQVTAIPNHDTVIFSSENMTSDVPVQSAVSDPLKENVPSDDLNNMSIAELRRRLKILMLDGEKSNCNKTDIVKEVDKKRTALQSHVFWWVQKILALCIIVDESSKDGREGVDDNIEYLRRMQSAS